MNIAIYARYSSDLQNPSSIDAQVQLCHELIKDKFNVEPEDVMIFSDSAKSGENIANREGFKNLVDFIRAGQVDVVVAEGLDRISRSLTDTSHTYDIFTHYKTKIFTAHEGEINELHIGLKGTMNSLFMKDLKAKILRGQKERTRAGFHMGSPSYGYYVIRGKVDEKNQNVNGIRKINPEQAKIVKLIFEQYANGESIAQIMRNLDEKGIPSPKGKKWVRKTILGLREKEEGILRNEIYIGTLVYNKTRIVVNPETKKSQMIVKPKEEWVRGYVPHLRIIDDELWKKARNRDLFVGYKRMPLKPKPVRKKQDLKPNQSALTGFVFCGVCGGQKSRGKFTRYICDNNRYHHTCRNGRSANEKQIFEKLWKMLFDRIEKDSDFKALFEKKIKSNENLLSIINKQEKEIESRLDKLTEGIEYGVNGCLQRAIELKKEQDKLNEGKRTIKHFTFPDKIAIKEKFLKELTKVSISEDRIEIRAMLRALVNKIVLTPKPDKKTGENIEIFLNHDCWARFWLLITKK